MITIYKLSIADERFANDIDRINVPDFYYTEITAAYKMIDFWNAVMLKKDVNLEWKITPINVFSEKEADAKFQSIMKDVAKNKKK